MALLDVSEVLDDPMLTSVFDVRRRSLACGENGRAGEGAPTLHSGIVGVLTYESPSETRKDESGQYSPRNLKIFTRFHLYKASDGYAPDEIVYDGEVFEILDVQSYKNFGSGFYVGVARSIKVMNQP